MNSVRPRQIRILIVDDSALVRHSLASLFEECVGVEIVGEARDGTEAVVLLESLQPDVMTLDLHMPLLNGIEVLRAVGGRFPKTTIIVLTVLDEPGYREECVRLGAKYFLAKDAQPDELIETVKKIQRDL